MIAGIVSEFNPFHNGHKFLLEEIRRNYLPELIVTAMSPDFTMRGEVSILSKMDRTSIAIENGVDLVLEIPTISAIESAEKYAYSAIKILMNAGVSDLFFGMEKGTVDDLYRISDIMDTDEYSKRLKCEIDNHFSFHHASKRAIVSIDQSLAELKCEIDNHFSFHHASKRAIVSIDQSLQELMELPNVSLAVEYVRAIRKLGSQMVPHQVQRKDSGYFDGINSESNIQSATTIRNLMEKEKDYRQFVPFSNEFKQAYTKDIYPFVRCEILRSTVKDLSDTKGVTEGLENALKASAAYETYEDFVSSLVSKRNREVKIKRIMVYILLGIKKGDIYDSELIRILGFSKNGKKYLSKIRKTNSFLYATIRKGLDESCYREIEFSKIRLLVAKDDQTQIRSFYYPVISGQ